ncbi:class I SAM-dependent methyltransferase [Silicimonas sp. MF1-12-2]|uniref:class I SAM-dependent methyltransferase n=1 Tax=Silicimonas sp. MF1-12-2 TaxID=3384793 RepID=UPI0039B434E4
MSYADAWLKWSHILEAGAAPLTERMLELGKARSARAVLDVGTGIGEPGISAAQVMEQAGRVLGIDPDPNMIALARNKAREGNVRKIDFEVANVETINLVGGSFDLILARWSLMFVSDLASTITRLCRALKPGGHLVAATWSSPDRVPALSIAKAAVHRHFGLPGSPHDAVSTFSLSGETEITSLLCEAGFRDITIRPIDVVYDFASVSEFIQYRLDVAGPLWPGMDAGSSKEVEDAFEAIGSDLKQYKKPDGTYRLTNNAICIHCRA